MSELPVNEALLQQLEMLQTLVQNNVAGQFGGNHRSKTYGSSCEFADFRDYVAGDDIKKIDWNAYARFEKLYYKLYLDERQLHTRIYIDASRSMTYGNAKKDVQAVRIAATLAYISVCEMDKVSVYVIKENQVHEIISAMHGREMYFNEIGKLNDIVFEGDSYISEALLPAKVGYGDGLSVIISDFLTDNDYEAAIDHLVSKRRDVCCVQVLSKEETSPKSRGKLHFFDSENLNRSYRKNINREIINAYKAAYAYATGRIRDFCMARGATYVLVAAEKPVTEVFYGDFVASGVAK